jgi:hypothetical protein
MAKLFTWYQGNKSHIVFFLYEDEGSTLYARPGWMGFLLRKQDRGWIKTWYPAVDFKKYFKLIANPELGTEDYERLVKSIFAVKRW